MKKDELLKGIEEDKILEALTETLKVATENAKLIPKKAEERECMLIGEYLNYHNNVEPPSNTYDIDEIENAVGSVESKDSIARKAVAMGKVKRRDWRIEKNYREAMAQYLTYITPILTDVEKAKQECRNKKAEILARYNKELAEVNQELSIYESKIEEIFGVAELAGDYRNYKRYELNYGRNYRSDYVAAINAENYSKPIEMKNRKSFSQWPGQVIR